jgi:MYXO-CTERM domain-containing protein
MYSSFTILTPLFCFFLELGGVGNIYMHMKLLFELPMEIHAGTFSAVFGAQILLIRFFLQGVTVVRQSAVSNARPGILRSRFLQLMTAATLALSGASASAGVLSVTTQQSGSTVTFNVFDSDPTQMCDMGICFADFAIDFDPAKLAFLDGATTLPYWSMANAAAGGPLGSQVLVSFMADELELAGNKLLFSLGFQALAAGDTGLTVGLRDFGLPPGPYQPDPVNVTIPLLAVAVPEPSSALLAAIGLAGLVSGRRRQTHAPGQSALSA